ncbi:hypothetical protein HYV11_02185 [Candidatus Dependentiae bacterium]|nr:hypothetical protein [Candidatus Dependentiae bacterium]
MKRLFFSLLLFSFLHHFSIKSLNPFTDFRSPRSLLEEMHIKMSDICLLLESALAKGNDDLSSIFSDVSTSMDYLAIRYGLLANTSKNHRVNHEDKEMLQKMIDRIDQLLKELEDGNKDDAKKDLQKVRSLCFSLKDQMNY